MSTTLEALKDRQNLMSERLKEIIAENPYKLFNNADVINRYGLSLFEELASHHRGEPIVSTYFRDVYGYRPSGKADSMRHSRQLRKLESEGQIELFTASNGSQQVRWAVIKEVAQLAKDARSTGNVG